MPYSHQQYMLENQRLIEWNGRQKPHNWILHKQFSGETILNGVQQSNDCRTRISFNENKVLQLVATLQSDLETKAFSK